MKVFLELSQKNVITVLTTHIFVLSILDLHINYSLNEFDAGLTKIIIKACSAFVRICWWLCLRMAACCRSTPWRRSGRTLGCRMRRWTPPCTTTKRSCYTITSSMGFIRSATKPFTVHMILQCLTGCTGFLCERNEDCTVLKRHITVSTGYVEGLPTPPTSSWGGQWWNCFRLDLSLSVVANTQFTPLYLCIYVYLRLCEHTVTLPSNGYDHHNWSSGSNMISCVSFFFFHLWI